MHSTQASCINPSPSSSLPASISLIRQRLFHQQAHRGHLLKRWGVLLLFSGVVLSLASCSSLPTNTAKSPTASPTTTSASPATPTATPSVIGKDRSASQNNVVIVLLYQVDDQCSELIAEKISVDADRPIAATVEQILAKQSNADFKLSGYRLNVEPNNGIATIDFRLTPDSKRGMASLSSCEQIALFSSLRKTLTSNSAWKIKTVRFTERGQEINL